MGGNRIEQLFEGPDTTQAFAERFASQLLANTVLAFRGDLGAGKTTFLAGLVRGLGGAEEIVQSPTFLYLHIYTTCIPVFHFDLYRLRCAKDFIQRGFEEYFDKEGIVAIEWPERIEELLPPHISLYFSYISETCRKIVIE